MALTEQRTVNQITLLTKENAINVQWKNQILRDGEEISYTYERKSYSQDQKAEFESEVEGAAAYVTVMGW